MKIWCVDNSNSFYNIHSQLYLTKAEALKAAKEYPVCTIYQVEDIWGWCARNFERVIEEVIAKRTEDNGYVCLGGLAEELRETAEHCGIKHFNVKLVCHDCLDEEVDSYTLTVAWYHQNKVYNEVYHLTGLEYFYELIPLYKEGWE